MTNTLFIVSRAAAFCVILSIGPFASAAITGTFVPAVDGVNSFQSVDGVSAFSSTTATPGLWHERVGVFDIIDFPSPASGAYQGQDKAGATTHNEVVTTLTGLTAGGDYDIYMIYGINTAANSGAQDIDAGFASGSLTTLTEGGGVDTGHGLMAGGGATWRAYEQLIGTVAADGSGEIKVYVDATTNAERSVYNGLSYVFVPPPAMLTLQIHPASGEMTIVNDSGVAIDTDGYEISSAGGSLDAGSWNSLQDQDYEGSGDPGDGMGWEEMGVPGANSLSEAILTTSYEFADAESVSLGNAFNTGVGTQDIALDVRSPNGEFLSGIVEYLLLGDMDGDGSVDTDDVNPFVQALTDRVSYDLEGYGVDADAIGDVNGDGSFNLGDVADFKAAVSGSGSFAAASSVPEPSAFVLSGLGLVALAIGRRRK